MKRLILSSIAAWLAGIIAYFVIAGGINIEYLVYGALSSAIAAFPVFFIVCLPLLKWLSRHVDRSSGKFVLPLSSLFISVIIGFVICAVLPTCSSEESVLYAVVFAVVGLVNGIGYARGIGSKST